MPQTRSFLSLRGCAAFAFVASVAACSGSTDPNLNGINGEGTGGLDGAGATTGTGATPGAGATGAGGALGVGAGTNGSGATNAGTGGTTVVCTPGCEDVPRENETCAQAKEWGFCEQDWFDGHCKATCGTCDGTEETCVEVPNPSTGGASNGSGGSSYGGTSNVTPVPNGSPQGWASRYWDCCKQHCGWPSNAGNPADSCNSQDQPLGDYNAQSACSGGGAYTCWSMAPWAVSDNLAYGFAAVPPGGACGKCYQLDFTGQSHNAGNDAGSQSLAGKTMIVQATNIGHDVNGGQFDILIPGGGVGAFNACSQQWGVSNSALGQQYGGLLADCGGGNRASCLRQKCNTLFAGKAELLEGCLFHADWMGAADNPSFRYAEVSCPAALNAASGM